MWLFNNNGSGGNLDIDDPTFAFFAVLALAAVVTVIVILAVVL